LGLPLGKALGVGLEGLIEHDLASGVDLLGAAFVNAGGRHHPDAAVPVLVVVPVKVATAEAARILDGPESLGKARAVFQRLELRFGVRVVVGNMRAAVALRELRLLEMDDAGWILALPFNLDSLQVSA
jgi:hypothetical protein